MEDLEIYDRVRIAIVPVLRLRLGACGYRIEVRAMNVLYCMGMSTEFESQT